VAVEEVLKPLAVGAWVLEGGGVQSVVEAWVRGDSSLVELLRVLESQQQVGVRVLEESQQQVRAWVLG
jgi:hypothetical protein